MIGPLTQVLLICRQGMHILEGNTSERKLTNDKEIRNYGTLIPRKY